VQPGQVVSTHVPLSPSSIIWYQPMGGDALKVTVGLALHWTGRSAPTYTLLVEYGELYLIL